jgi:HK97 family phage portal protein
VSFISRLFTRKGTNQKVTAHKAYDCYKEYPAAFQSYVHTPGKPVWMEREYSRFADEAYLKNVVAHRSVAMIASAAASVRLMVYRLEEQGKTELLSHPLLSLLTAPNPCMTGRSMVQALLSYQLVSGNAYLQAVGSPGELTPQELYVLRPDRVQVLPSQTDCVPQGYRYQVGKCYWDYPVDRVTGRGKILHLKEFHPLNDWYGLSPVEAAAYAIDQHNQASSWNQALLQNGARPSGALVVRDERNGGAGHLSEEQFRRLKHELDESYQGAANAGRPLLLEGGLDWKEMALSPKDMDFIEMKNSAAREIALAFGVPPQMLGIPGDNKYQNMAEARMALWEQTVLPLLDQLVMGLNNWLVPMFEGERLLVAYDKDSIDALSYKRDGMWDRIASASFLSDEEKRRLLGIGSGE